MMNENKPRILIAEDEADERTILQDILTYEGYPVLVAADGEEALRLAQEHPVDVALLDVRMPGMSGLELTQRLRQINPRILVALMTAYSTAEDAVMAREHGAVHYLPKPCRPVQVVQIVERMWQNYLCNCHERIGENEVDWRLETVIVKGQAISLRTLTDRERDVLNGLAAGKSDREIAAELGICQSSVRTHLQNIMRKFGLKNRTQAALFWQAYLRFKSA